MMRMTTSGIDALKAYEGLRLKSYQDSAGIWTIGYGTTRGVRKGQTITVLDAEAMFRTDLQAFEKCVAKAVTTKVSRKQFDSLVSLAYNIGCGAFESSTVLKRLNSGDETGAADAFLMWSKVTIDGQKQDLPGLRSRREKERSMFLAGKRDKKYDPQSFFIRPVHLATLAVLAGVWLWD